MQQEELEQLTKEQLSDRIVNLTQELRQAEQVKKAVVGGHNDNIKRVKAEIKEASERHEVVAASE